MRNAPVSVRETELMKLTGYKYTIHISIYVCLYVYNFFSPIYQTRQRLYRWWWWGNVVITLVFTTRGMKGHRAIIWFYNDYGRKSDDIDPTLFSLCSACIWTWWALSQPHTHRHRHTARCKMMWRMSVPGFSCADCVRYRCFNGGSKYCENTV